MTQHDELTSKMADYLGGELNDAQRLEFEEQMRSDPELQARVEGFRRTVETLQQLDAPVATDASHYTPKASASASSSTADATASRSMSARLWRYAAVMAIAFLGGFLARGGSQQTAPQSDRQIVQDDDDAVDAGGARGAGGGDDPAVEPTAEDSWRNRFLRQYGEHRSDSGLGRSLIALARSGR